MGKKENIKTVAQSTKDQKKAKNTEPAVEVPKI